MPMVNSISVISNRTALLFWTVWAKRSKSWKVWTRFGTDVDLSWRYAWIFNNDARRNTKSDLYRSYSNQTPSSKMLDKFLRCTGIDYSGKDYSPSNTQYNTNRWNNSKSMAAMDTDTSWLPTPVFPTVLLRASYFETLPISSTTHICWCERGSLCGHSILSHSQSTRKGVLFISGYQNKGSSNQANIHTSPCDSNTNGRRRRVEVRPIFVHQAVPVVKLDIGLERNWNRVLRTAAYLLRFISRSRKKTVPQSIYLS